MLTTSALPQRTPASHRARSSGAAYIVVVGVIGVLMVVAFTLAKNTTRGRWLTLRLSQDQKVMDCAEAVTNLTYRRVSEEMNDPKALYDLLQFRGLNLDQWFVKFRLPQTMANGSVDPLAYRNQAVSLAETQSNDFGFELNVGADMLAKLSKTYTRPELPELEPMFKDLGGNLEVTCEARIKKAYGILPKTATYEIPGLSVDTTNQAEGAENWMKKFTDSLMSGNPSIDFDLTPMVINALPNIGVADFLERPVKQFTFPVYGVPFPFGMIIWPLIEKFVRDWTADFTLKGLAKKLIGNSLNVKIPLGPIKDAVKNAVTGLLPDEIRLGFGQIGWGLTVEKMGIFEVKTTVKWQPQYPDGPTFTKTLIGQRDVRVADIQPIAPNHSFFVANSGKLAEDPAEKNPPFAGNVPIDWHAGTFGALIIHNISIFDGTIFQRLVDFLGCLTPPDLQKINSKLYIPGLVRVNGTARSKIRLPFGIFCASIGNESFFDKLKATEFAALLINEGHTHDIIPKICEDWNFFGYATPFHIPPLERVRGFDWPWVTDSTVWIPFPLLYNRVSFFGDFHVEPPISLRIEGNVDKTYSKITLHAYHFWLYIPIISVIIDFPIPIPIPINDNKTEPYGFCKYPPSTSGNNWSGNEACNLPDNLYSPAQYTKKAAYFYETTGDFSDDIENRSVEMNVDGQMRKVFVCDGVTFIQGSDGQGLFLRSPLYVMGRGMLVAAGNIHLHSVKRVDPPDGPHTVFSLVARNGALINQNGNIDVEAACYGDRGVMNPLYARLRIYGNLVVNRINREDMQGKIDVYYEANRCHSSILSYFKDVAKYDPSRYHVSMSKKWRLFEFQKQ